MHTALLPLLVVLVASPLAAAPSPARFGVADFGRLRISQRPCWLNTVQQTCVITTAEGSDVLRIDFSAGDRPFWVFTPTTGAPTTDRRPYLDAQGRTWLFSGHHAFELGEQGRDRNVIRVASP